MFTNKINRDLKSRAGVEKTVHEIERHQLSSNEKGLGAVFVKNVMMTVFSDMKKPIPIEFHERRTTLNSADYCQLFRKNST